LNYRQEEETGLYYAGDYNLRGRTPQKPPRLLRVENCLNKTLETRVAS